MVSMHSLDSLIFFKHVLSCPYLRASVYSSLTYFFNSSAFICPPCVQICLCNWKIPVGQLIVASFSSQSLSLFLSLSLPGRLERNWSLGGSREEPGKEGTKGRPSAAITTLHFLSSLSLSPCSSLPRLPSLPSPHWPAPQIKTSDKKMGSIKKGEKATEREKEGSP